MFYDLKMYYYSSFRRWLVSCLYVLLLASTVSQVTANDTEDSQVLQSSIEDVRLPGAQPLSDSTIVQDSSTSTHDSVILQSTTYSTVLETTTLPVITERPPTSTVLETIEPSETSQVSITSSVLESRDTVEHTSEFKPPSDIEQPNGEPLQEPVLDVAMETVEDNSGSDRHVISGGGATEVTDGDHIEPADVHKGETISALPEQPDATHETAAQAQFKTITDLAGHGGMAVDVDKTGQREEKHEEEGLTFNEWTQKVLAEAEKDKKDVDSESPPKIPSTKKQRKNKNYALIECGAKILAQNPEAKDSKSVLNFNKDEYMINPCKAKKWFIVELCEPIQAHSVEIASLELFSSSPKYFKVYLSDRYPTKDWQLAGEFNTTEERVVQSFLITQLQGYFAKYVKVELLDHYGDEHFCPVTLFRVFGKGVDEEEDIQQVGLIDEDDDDEDDDDDIATTDGSKTDTKNLFTSAKDIVLNVVKKVLNVEEQNESNNATEITEIPTNTDGHTNGTKEHVKHEDQLPCPPGASVDAVGSVDVTGDVQPMGNQPVTPVPGATDAISAIVTKLDDDEQVETSIHIGAHLPDGSIPHTSQEPAERCFLGPVQNLVDSCWYPSCLCRFKLLVLNKCAMLMEPEEKEPQPVFVELKSQLIEQTEKVSQTSESILGTLGDFNGGISISLSERMEVIDKTSSVQSSMSDETTVISSGQSEVLETSQSVLSTHSSVNVQSDVSHTSSLSLSAGTVTSVVADHDTQIEPTVSQTAFVQTSTYIETSDTNLPTLEQDSSQTPYTDDITIYSSQSTTVSGGEKVTEHTSTPALTTSWKPNTEDVMDSTSQNIQSGTGQTVSQTAVSPDAGQSSDKVTASSVDMATRSEPPSGERQKAGENTQSQQQQQTGQSDDKQDVEGTDDKTPVEEKAQDTDKISTEKGVSEKSETGKGSGKGKGNLDLVHIPVIPSKRESAIMRLSNRMKVLEQNVSLSSRFLEELSRRYKKQSEDMMKLLNKTMAHLNNMTVESQVSNKLHEDEMGEMERRLENLTTVVTQLTTSLQQLNKQVTDRQMIWTSIEIIIIIIVLLVTRRRQPENADIPNEVRQLIESMPSKPQSNHTYRRNSISGPATPSKSRDMVISGIQKYSSEKSLAQPTVANVKPVMTEASTKQHKKKKKKQKNLDFKVPLDGTGPQQRKKPPDPLPWKQESTQVISGPQLTSSSESVTSGASDSRGIVSRKSSQHTSSHRPLTKSRSSSMTESGLLETGVTAATGPSSSFVIGGETKVKGHRRNKSLPKVSEQKQRQLSDKSVSVDHQMTGKVNVDSKKHLRSVPGSNSAPEFRNKVGGCVGGGASVGRVSGYDDMKPVTCQRTKVQKQPALNDKQHVLNYPQETDVRYPEYLSVDQSTGQGLLYCTSSLNESLQYDYEINSACATNGFATDYDKFTDREFNVDNIGGKSCARFEPGLEHISNEIIERTGPCLMADRENEHDDFNSTKMQDKCDNMELKKGFWFFNR